MNKKLRNLALLTVLAAVPMATIAGPPGLDDRKTMDVGERVDRLTEALELDANQAEAIQDTIEASHAEGEGLREAIKSTLEALTAAQEAGDDKAMRKGLKEWDALTAEAHALREATRDAIRAELTLEQNVLFVQQEAMRHHRTQKVMERVRERHERGERPDRGERPERRAD